MKAFYCLVLFSLLTFTVSAQDKSEVQPEKEKFSMKVLKDSLDGKLDLSDFLISYHGFIPVIQLITEPALGGIGAMFTPVFIQPNKVHEKGKYIPPNITAGFIGYSANKSWGGGAMRSASLPKQHLKYKVGGGYGDMNMDFFRNFPVIGEKQLGLNFNSAIFFGNILREVGDTDLYFGLQYLFLHNKVKPEFDLTELPDFIDDKTLNNKLSNVGVNMQYDKRDNVFTPNKGLYFTSAFRVNASWTGSDYDYRNWNITALQYFQLKPKWVSGFRFEGNLQFGDAPFYMEPGVNLRGVPMARYQGQETYVVETEQRYDFTKRWSAVAFVGAAKAPTKEVSFIDSELIYNYGTGFRYLIARKFNMRTGIDVAWSNEDFGWYIVFGSAWNNRN
ncbi:BamA/TamA family outer membrane protein [Algoriphagus chordae]|nr:BamA/TamA family outer membrane protein [Algoriphagus chordae]